MKRIILIACAVLFLGAFIQGAQGDYSPSPGHLLVINNLVATATGCSGSVELAYGFLPSQATRSWEAVPQEDCSIDVNERADPDLIWRPIGPVKVLSTVIDDGQTFTKDTTFNYPVLPCTADAIDMAADTSDYSPTNPTWWTWGSDGGDNCWKWTKDHFIRNAIYNRDCHDVFETGCVIIDFLHGATATYSYCKIDFRGGLDPDHHDCQTSDEDAPQVPYVDIEMLTNVLPGTTADLLRGAG